MARGFKGLHAGMYKVPCGGKELNNGRSDESPDVNIMSDLCSPSFRLTGFDGRRYIVC